MANSLLTVDLNDEDVRTAAELFRALALPVRIRILRQLSEHPMTPSDLAQALGIPVSTVTLNVRLLERAGLIDSYSSKAVRGLSKTVALAYRQLTVILQDHYRYERRPLQVSVPVGSFVDFSVTPTCGLASADRLIGLIDDPASFYDADRHQAELVWFFTGYVEYVFSVRYPHGATLRALQVSAEVCSEAPLHNLDWPSDITCWINGHEIGTWTSPGDFGGQRGILTPGWWLDWDSQYGQLKRWLVTPEGAFLDGIRVGETRVEELGLEQGVVRLRIGVRPDAANARGINIFGAKFGNYPQHILVSLAYDLPSARVDSAGAPDRA